MHVVSNQSSSHKFRLADQDKVRVYKETRNGMLGADYSTKFSPWLAHGCISARIIHDEVCSALNIKDLPNRLRLCEPLSVLGSVSAMPLLTYEAGTSD